MTLPSTGLKIKITYEQIDNNEHVPSFSAECPSSRVKDRRSGVYEYVERTIKGADRSVGHTKFYRRKTSKYVIWYSEEEEEEEEEKEEEEEQQQQHENVKKSQLLIFIITRYYKKYVTCPQISHQYSSISVPFRKINPNSLHMQATIKHRQHYSCSRRLITLEFWDGVIILSFLLHDFPLIT
jgi:hypothetical protein